MSLCDLLAFGDFNFTDDAAFKVLDDLLEALWHDFAGGAGDFVDVGECRPSYEGNDGKTCRDHC